ncbi:MAG: hypothetical protein ACUVRZ_02490 [Desulfobacca sp.]|uniref:hypothetical protein n=1 Tax=Desulfobacca sp. TaxID=2067990 RepID=UPI00404918D4
MAHIDGGSPKDQGFPDEFGLNLFHDRADQRSETSSHPAGEPPPFWGYVTPTWFGPFLLSPRRRQAWGRC